MLLSRRHTVPIGIALLALVTTLLVAACGGSSGSSTSQAATTPAPTAAATTAATTAPTPATSASTPTQAASTAPTKVVQVKIVEKNNQYSFDPASITVPKGAQVVWTNTSDAPHTVTSNDNTFNTPSNLMQNQTFMMVFNTTGTFAYHCAIHTYMKGTITVTS
jgi:plastocyanin